MASVLHATWSCTWAWIIVTLCSLQKHMWQNFMKLECARWSSIFQFLLPVKSFVQYRKKTDSKLRVEKKTSKENPTKKNIKHFPLGSFPWALLARADRSSSFLFVKPTKKNAWGLGRLKDSVKLSLWPAYIQWAVRVRVCTDLSPTGRRYKNKLATAVPAW